MDAGLSVDPDAVEAGVFWVAPVSQHPHLDDLESLVVFLLRSGGMEDTSQINDARVRYTGEPFVCEMSR